MHFDKYDVIVAGGGSAGVAAAIASAETGANTLLIERNNCLGGASTMRGVSSYCGMFTLGKHPRQVVGGVGGTVLSRLRQLDAVSDVTRHRGVFVVFEPEPLKTILDDMCQKAGVTVMFGAFVAAATRDGERITFVTIADHSGLHQIHADAFVDCTGEGDLMAQGGADTRYGNEGFVNLGTLATRFGGIPKGVTVTADDLARAVAALNSPPGTLTKDKSVILRLPTSHDIVCYVASADYDPRDTSSLSAAERDGRKQVNLYQTALKSIPGCEAAYLVSTGPEFGTRESRHIQSHRMFTWDDIENDRRFDDCIGLGAWGAEWHDRGDYSSSFDLPPQGRAYQIPLSCLTSRNTTNLFAAGRLADGDRKGGAAIRVMGTAFVTGQASGIAAALSVSGAPAIKNIQNYLGNQQAIIEL